MSLPLTQARVGFADAADDTSYSFLIVCHCLILLCSDNLAMNPQT